ncbi:hypothetical protein ABID42_001822 [Arcicella rosea]|uniref:hypothetical protein n=1 Tax=Arcicella rosea TaxID=502909 RepID=UPI00345D3CED
MSTVKVIISFSRLRDDDLDTQSQVIISKLTGNVNFPNPIPTLAEITASRNAYVDALIVSKTGGRQETLKKNHARKELEQQLGLLALYIQANCKNDDLIALGSGFEIQKSKAPIGILAKPSNFKVENGPLAASLYASVDKIEGAKSYLFEITKAPVTEDSIWQVESSTAKTFLFEDLVAGTQYAIKVAGVGSNPKKVFSDVLYRFAQ